MSQNYRYVVDRARDWHGNLPAEPRLLDYGCGAGRAVEVALQEDFDAHGVDLYYSGGSSERLARSSGLWGTRIHRLKGSGQIPFENESFDVIIANQVFEHLEDFGVPLKEIWRVMRSDGIFINVFPSQLVWREGHCGIPLAHRFRRGSQARYWYTLGLRLVGFGSHKEGKGVREWTRHKLEWLDRWVFYRGLDDILNEFERGFFVDTRDADFILYRIRHHKILRPLERILSSEFLGPFFRFTARRLALPYTHI